MQLLDAKTILAKLIDFTNERDSSTLEISLAHILFDLAAPGSIVIYRLLDVEKQLFSIITAAQSNEAREAIPEEIRDALMKCIQTLSKVSYPRTDGRQLTLYPLKGVKNKPVAVIAIEPTGHVEAIEDVTQMLLQIYQNLIALMNDNEHDTLTGLLNRKTFEHKTSKIFSQLLSQHLRKEDADERKYFLAIFDIDHFKRVNDKFGHLIGDEVLLLFSQLMTKSFREKDLLFRFGGEEFVAIFECAEIECMQATLDRFRIKVAQFDFPQAGNVTVSVGFTELRPHDTSSQIIDRADVALYFAKNHGRNRVCGYEKLVESGDLQETAKVGEIELF